MARAFSWANFGADFVRGIVLSDKTKGEKPSKNNTDIDQFLPYINLVCNRPDSDFIKRYRTEIEDLFIFKNEDALELVSKNLLGNKIPKQKAELVEALRKKRLSPELVALYSTVLKKHGKVLVSEVDSYSRFHQPLAIDLKVLPGKDIPLYDYQEEAVIKLKKTFIDDDLRSGLLVMPTGSGKTRTAVYFLLRHMIKAGYQIIWLTHRALLVDQPAQTFYDMSPLMNLDGKKNDTLRIACVSNEHSKIKVVQEADDIVILMVPSAYYGIDYIPSILKKKVMIVVDEAHHTYARTYRRVIETIRKSRPDAKLLGLTATPVRTDEDEDKSLKNLYENRFIYQIPMSKLISQGVLAQPCRTSISTNYKVETTKEERNYIRRWGELPPNLVDKIAKSKKRNSLIVETYLKHAKKGDKTLIFAMNQIHAFTLYTDMKKEGIKADFVYSGQPQNDLKIENFKNGSTDVLININILTEGSDIPGVNSVYLTRPTNSDVLLMQMIGRGMRGVRVGGKEKVNIVDFVDKWDRFIDWLNPDFIINGELIDEAEHKKALPRATYQISWSDIKAVYEDIRTSSLNQEIVYTSLPYGWFQVEDEYGLDTSVLVFEDQYEGYLKFQADFADYRRGNVKAIDISKKYWRNFGKLPSINDLDMIVSDIKHNGSFPVFYKFTEREFIDPALIAHDARLGNTGPNDIDIRLEKTYVEHKGIIDNVYSDFESYKKLVYNYLYYNTRVTPIGVPIKEVDKVLLPFDTEPYHDLGKLTIKAYEIFKSVYKKAPKAMPDVSWTDNQPNEYFACYQEGRIQMNSVLNSKQVPEDTIVYIIYHELLHYRQFLTGYLLSSHHDAKFREWAREFPDYTKHEQFLAGKFRQFDTKYSLWDY